MQQLPRNRHTHFSMVGRVSGRQGNKKSAIKPSGGTSCILQKARERIAPPMVAPARCAAVSRAISPSLIGRTALITYACSNPIHNSRVANGACGQTRHLHWSKRRGKDVSKRRPEKTIADGWIFPVASSVAPRSTRQINKQRNISPSAKPTMKPKPSRERHHFLNLTIADVGIVKPPAAPAPWPRRRRPM